jgi:hypothetical protein
LAEPLDSAYIAAHVRMTSEERLKTFRAELPRRDVPDLVQRHITYGDCFTLSATSYIDLKARIAHNFGIHTSEVLVVGSAKLGFSIVPEKRYRPFGESSDIDVALCSNELFDAIWKDVFDYWARPEFWPGLDDFRRYLFRGWMRPDKLPPEKSFTRSQEWWEFFRKLTMEGTFGPYKIRGALYKSWYFLEKYQQKCVSDCKLSETAQ